MKILVSACLLGRNCKYDGGNNFRQNVVDLLRGHEVVEVCPEVMAGRSIPRKPIELLNGKFIEEDGTDVDAQVQRGVQDALEIAREEKIDLAILKSRSPTCGVRQIYDGTFSHRLVDGEGAFAKVLRENGFRVLDVEDLGKGEFNI
ncbi:MAG: DUF523 domain-containing protein [Thermoguttaceae bacterium]|nr:DUF523 domain-containing protein [Thermoguttaceae bacterium]